MKFVKCLTVAVTAVTLGVICAVCASAATIYKSPDGNFEYTIGSDGNITIGSYIGKGGEAVGGIRCRCPCVWRIKST